MRNTGMPVIQPANFIILSILCSAIIINLGCASSPPSKTLPQSKVTVLSVDNENYRKYVGADVNLLIVKLQQAEDAESNKQYLHAEQLAQQILIDVEFIQLKTQRIIAQQEVADLEANITSLNHELEWREPVEITPLNH